MIRDMDYDEFMKYSEAIARKGYINANDKNDIFWEMLNYEIDDPMKVNFCNSNKYYEDFINEL